MRRGTMRVLGISHCRSWPMTANAYRCLTLIGLAALWGPDCLAAQRRPAAETSQSACSGAVRRWWGQHGGGGRIVCASDPTRPAILLFHGLHQDARTWTAPSYVEYAYDYRDNPGEKRVGDTHSSANAGVYKVAPSKWLYGDDRAAWDKSVNWFDYLVSRGFTVATWGQPGLTFSAAYPSALEAFDSLLSHSRQRSPAAPPAVALIGHSRGGLVLRKVLKNRASTGRVQWVVTLHSPHQGSALGQTPGRLVAETVDLLDCCIPGDLTAGLKKEVKDLVTEAMRPMTRLVWPDENRELTPDGPLIRDLRSGEQAIPGVQYYTFGGTDPTYYKLYLWHFDAMSSVPQVKDLTTYYVWRVRPVEIGPLSPIMDKLRDFIDEVKPGKGDGLVTDVSARLPWSTHTTNSLNHAEVLWNRPLQQRVAGLLSGPTRKVRIR